MKKFFAVSVLGAVLLAGSVSGCVNSSKHTASVDDQWIQSQVEQGREVPEQLR